MGLDTLQAIENIDNIKESEKIKQSIILLLSNVQYKIGMSKRYVIGYRHWDWSSTRLYSVRIRLQVVL